MAKYLESPAISQGQGQLPATAEGLHNFLLIGKEQLKAHKAKLRAIDKIPEAHAAKGAALQDAQALADVLVDAEARLGVILAGIPDKKASSGAGTRSLPANITKKESHRAQTIASRPDIVEQVKEKALEKGNLVTAEEIYREIKSPTLASKFTGDQESFTPGKYIESARRVMGSIDLDPASNEMAQQTVKATVYYTKEDDGLDKPWSGNIFLNPPYSHPEIKYFVDKLLTELKPGQQAILLTNNNTDTNFFHDAARKASALCFTKGRINFIKPDGSTSSPTNGQAFFYFGDNKAGFINEFSQYGLIMELSAVELS